MLKSLVRIRARLFRHAHSHWSICSVRLATRFRLVLCATGDARVKDGFLGRTATDSVVPAYGGSHASQGGRAENESAYLQFYAERRQNGAMPT